MTFLKILKLYPISNKVQLFQHAVLKLLGDVPSFCGLFVILAQFRFALFVHIVTWGEVQLQLFRVHCIAIRWTGMSSVQRLNRLRIQLEPRSNSQYSSCV